MNVDEKAQNQAKEERLNRIGANSKPQAQINQKYSAFIKSLRIALPIIAMILIAITFSWNKFQEAPIAAIEITEETEQKIGKNELLNPEFTSMDSKGQPYVVTASKATQSADAYSDVENNIMLLERPSGKMTLNSGDIVTMRADEGTYDQSAQTLLLKSNVTLGHDLGYEMFMQNLDIDMDAGTAQSNSDISGKGPEGTITAKGVYASSSEDKITFTGPAKLVLITDNSPLDFGGVQ